MPLQGAICLDTLSSQWSPVLTIKSALISLQSLLSTPEPKDPQDAEVAGMLMVSGVFISSRACRLNCSFLYHLG